jgi:hypothetical protein
MRRYMVLIILPLFLVLSACGGGGGSSTSAEYQEETPINDQTSGFPGFKGIDAPATGIGYIGTTEPTTEPTTEEGSAVVTFLLTDAPSPQIDSAIVTISDMAIHKTGGAFFPVLQGERTLDLLDLQGGVTALLSEVELEAGKYTQIRFSVKDGTVVSGGETYDVVVPSDIIRLNRNIDVCSGGTLEIVIDFDADKSLKYNKGQDVFRMTPVVKIASVTSICPPDEGEDDQEGDQEDDEYDGPTGWFAVVLPPVDAEYFGSLTTIVDDIQVHDQGLGQLSTFEEAYEVDLLEGERQIVDEEGEPLYTVLVPPVEVPAGELDQVRLFFQPIVATENTEENADGEERTISIKLPYSEDAEGDGLKFFGPIEVCEDALTILQWDLDLSPEGIDFQDDEQIVHPEIHDVNLLVTCEPVEEETGG